MSTTPTRGVRALLSPRMLVLHVLVLVVVVALFSLGRWQVTRLGEATARAEAIEQRLLQEPVPVTSALAGLDTGDAAALAGLEFRPVTATGVWEPGAEVLQRGRSYGQSAGLGVLTPLRLEDGTAVLVRRGTVPFDNDLRPPIASAAPPTETVTVTGTLERSVPQPTGSFAQRDPDEGRLDIVFNADVERLAGQVDGRVLPMVLRLDAVATPGELPLPTPPPVPDRGSHLSYAIQWFSFAAIGTGMYALWLRRRIRGDTRAVAPTRPDPDQRSG